MKKYVSLYIALVLVAATVIASVAPVDPQR